ncbi:hypothetical protein R4Z09_16965 [Niallia oryzisoli]|uniref:Phage protein n=1 Tax=Niallia oryzisoli TaxID=1737571 RepID=A0ABZ2CAF8_9BACI
MSKLKTAEMVADMVGLDYGYVVEAIEYFKTIDEAFNWVFLSEENPTRPYTQEQLIQKLASVTKEDMEELNAKTAGEYLVIDADHTYITPYGVAYIRITR